MIRSNDPPLFMPSKKPMKKAEPPVIGAPKKGPAPLPLVRGMRDILPADWPYWQALFRAAEKLSEEYGYERIETPVLEETNLFVRGVGKATDIVEKEFFESVRPSSLIKRFVSIEEVASMVVFLASPLAAATNGAAVRVEGGLVRSIL